MDLEFGSIIGPALGLALAPAFPGIINRTKSVMAGRKGPPLLQGYYDVAKLFRKGATYSVTTTWLFRAGPITSLACFVTALLLLPFGASPPLLAFSGDLIVFVYLFGMARFAVVLAALDTGSSFEGMGASREVKFSVMAEPALLVGLAALARESGEFSLSQILPAVGAGPEVVLVAASMLVVYLSENSRIPFDDPNTHLELTMVHEVMALDHTGPDLAQISYGAALKLWILGMLVVLPLLPPPSGRVWLDGSTVLGALIGLAVAVGIVESMMARVRLHRAPHLLAGACVLAVLAFVLTLR